MLSWLAVFVLAQDMAILVRESAGARVPKARALAGDKELLRSVKEKNQSGESAVDIRRRDEQWIKDKAYPLRKELTTNACATRVRALIKDDPAIVEAFLMDEKGALVCASIETSDYWQGDEAKWTKTVTEGKAAFVDEAALDVSTGQYAIQLSVPVEDAGKRIGAVTLTLKIDRKQLGPSKD